mgnify:CR=1 FL=1
MLYNRVLPDSCAVMMHSPLMQAVQLLNEQPHGYSFLVVVNENRQLVGTLTDGDIRRGIMNGQSLDAFVEDFMCSRPIFAELKYSDVELNKLFSLVSAHDAFLPVVDGDRRLIEILVKSPPQPIQTSALIMAGGYGRRLGE